MRGRPPPQRRRNVVLVVAALALVVGLIVALSGGPDSAQRAADSFASAWARGDYTAMYSVVDSATQRRLGLAGLADAYRSEAETATATSLRVLGHARAQSGGLLTVPVAVQTRLFGRLQSEFRLRVTSDNGATRIAWTPALLFPGLRAGERLTRHTTLPPRASLLAADGTVLASGPAPGGGGQRSSPLGALVTSLVGEMGPIPASRRAALLAEGVPADAMVGASGLELALDDRLRGHPGGELLAGHRVLGGTSPQAATAVRTTISPAVQRASVLALGGQLGGIVAMRPSTGEILAVAGLGIDDVQPPGSTFKMVTLTGVLEHGLATPSTVFPMQDHAVLSGVQLQNANGETCGGTLAEAFAVSCNSVFAPLGAKMGASRLLATAESFGFNHPVGIAGAVESTIPPKSLTDDLAVGSSAIGQDEVQASPLQMALVAATIGNGGRRPTPVLRAADRARPVRVVPGAVARTVRQLMIGVVTSGTGVNAAIPGVVVAGKTGTAELTTTACPPGSANCTAAASDPRNTDAWFAAFAPARHPKIAVAVLMVRDGAGGDTAAPVAKQVLEAGLGSSG